MVAGVSLCARSAAAATDLGKTFQRLPVERDGTCMSWVRRSWAGGLPNESKGPAAMRPSAAIRRDDPFSDVLVTAPPVYAGLITTHTRPSVNVLHSNSWSSRSPPTPSSVCSISCQPRITASLLTSLRSIYYVHTLRTQARHLQQPTCILPIQPKHNPKMDNNGAALFLLFSI